MRLAVVLTLMTGCAVEKDVVRYTFYPGVTVAADDAGKACKRQCMQLLTKECSAEAASSEGTTLRIETRYAVGTYSEALGCPGLYSDCLLTCPGAVVDGAGPRIERVYKAADPDPKDDDEGDAASSDGE